MTEIITITITTKNPTMLLGTCWSFFFKVNSNRNVEVSRCKFKLCTGVFVSISYSLFMALFNGYHNKNV